MNYKDFFRGKKIAVVGLGPHGEMIPDIKFLLRLGADISLYDIRSEAKLQNFLDKVKALGLEKYSLGKVSDEELKEFELIILSPDISPKSLFLKKATESGVRIEFPDILFLKMVPAVTLIAVMGAAAKSTVAHMLHGILKKSFTEYEDQGLFFVDPPSLLNGTLTHLKKIKAGDVVLTRITDELMEEYYKSRLSPHVAVITSLLPGTSGRDRKFFDILEHQTYNNFIVAPGDVIDALKSEVNFIPKAKMLRTRGDSPSLALQAAELFKVSKEFAEKIIFDFKGLKGRLQFVKKIKGLEFYNDSASVTPLSTIFALQKLSLEKNIILILGGAYTGHDYGELTRVMPEYASTVILLPGSGSIGFRAGLESLREIKFIQAETLEDAVRLAKENAKKGDRVLFSPASEASGMFDSRKDRGEKFVKAVRSL